MKKLLLIFFIFCGITYSQTHSWIQAYNANTVMQSCPVVYGDTVYFIHDGFYKLYKNGSPTIKTGTNFYGFKSYYNGWGGGLTFVHNNKLYNYYATYVIPTSGAPWSNLYYMTSYDSIGSVITSLSSTPGTNTFLATTEDPVIVGDSLFAISLTQAVYPPPSLNDLMRYSFTSNVWTDAGHITEFNTPSDKAGQRFVSGLFNFGDTLYAITTYGSYGVDNGVTITGVYDSSCTLWRRNTATYTWDSLHTFNAGILLSGQKDNGSEYLLLTANDSSKSDVGLWQFDSGSLTLTKLPRCPGNLRIVGFYKNSNYLFEAVGISTVADSNKLYYYNGTSWDGGQQIYNTYYSGYIAINTIRQTDKFVTVSYKRTISDNYTVGVNNVIAYDTNYYQITSLSPTAGYYALYDTITARWHTNLISDSIQISISYDSAKTFNILDTLSNTDSSKVILDSIATYAILRYYNIQRNITAYSPFFIISNKTIKITSVTINQDKAIIYLNAIAVPQIKVEYSTDSLIWSYATTAMLHTTSPYQDTVDYTFTSGIHANTLYWKVTEIKDTTVYGLSISPVVSPTSLMYNPGDFCNTAYLDGSGVAGCIDKSCGWVANLTWTVWQTTLTSLASDGSANITSTALSLSKYQRDSLGLSTPSSVISWYTGGLTSSIFQNSTQPWIYNGRKYEIKSDGIYMTDMVNNVTYKVYDCTKFWSASTDPVCQATYSTSMDGYILFLTTGHYSLYTFPMLPYPPDLSLPISDTYTLTSPTGFKVTIIRNYFRGIYPRIK